MRTVLLPLASLALAGTAAAVCGFADESLALGTTSVTGDNTGFANEVTPSCQASNGVDYSYTWTAPSTGSFTVSTDGLFDSVLVVTDGADCATELACDDDSGPGTASLLTFSAIAGQEYVITVDSYSTTGVGGGPFTLLIEEELPAVCTFDGDAGSALATFTGDTCGAVDDLDGSSCGTGASEDQVWSWTAPATGTYTFSTTGSAYDTVISVYDGADCDMLLGCDDDVGNGVLSSELTLDLTAGQEIAIAVEGFNSNTCGTYALEIYAGCGDFDGDGICTVDDVCIGDDTTGDSDGDGTCDDTDFTLALSTNNPAAGSVVTMAVANAQPGAQVAFLLGTRTGFGPCHPTAPICAGVLAPKIVGRATADATGFARAPLRVPATAPSGGTVYIQAAWIDGTAGATSELEMAVVQ